jgi:hypothetical protein
VPAAAVIPAPIAYIKVVAVKKLVVGPFGTQTLSFGLGVLLNVFFFLVFSPFFFLFFISSPSPRKGGGGGGEEKEKKRGGGRGARRFQRKRKAPSTVELRSQPIVFFFPGEAGVQKMGRVGGGGAVGVYFPTPPLRPTPLPLSFASPGERNNFTVRKLECSKQAYSFPPRWGEV